MMSADTSGVDGQLWGAGVSVGDVVPTKSIPLTLQRLVMEAGVNRDFTPLHHDHEDSRRTGAPRAYANTMFIQSFLEATLRTWMGDLGRLQQLSIRMISFNLAGTVVTAGGCVSAVEPGEGRVTVTVTLWMSSDDVTTVAGTAVVELPNDPEAAYSPVLRPHQHEHSRRDSNLLATD